MFRSNGGHGAVATDRNVEEEMKFSLARIVKLLGEISFRDANASARAMFRFTYRGENREWRHAKLKPGIVAFH